MNTETPPVPIVPDSATGPPPGPIVVEVSDTQSHVKLDPEMLSSLIREALRAEGVDRASISVAVVDDATIRAVNRRHLGHDWATDVISFGLSEIDDDVLTGELVVSAETASAVAQRAGVSAVDELSLYLVHGLLHLCGYDDTTDENRAVIRRREGEVLAHLGRLNTYPSAFELGVETGTQKRARWTV